MKHIIASFLCKLCKEQAAQPGIFTAGEVSWNMGISIHVSCTAYKRTAPQGGILVFFLQDSTKTTFLNENLNHRRTRTLFFAKSGHLSSIFKKGRGDLLPLPLASCVSVEPEKSLGFLSRIKFGVHLASTNDNINFPAGVS